VNSKITTITLAAKPQDVFLCLKNDPYVTLLESAQTSSDTHHWSYIACAPLATLKSLDAGAALYDAVDPCTSPVRTWLDPFAALRDVLSQFNAKSVDVHLKQKPEGLGFTAGWIGYLGYDLIRSIERVPAVAVVDVQLPDMHLHLCDHVLAYEHKQARWYFCTTLLAKSDPKARALVWEATLNKALSCPQQPPILATGFKAGSVLCKTPAHHYLQQVQTLLNLVLAGDLLQANLSHRLEAAFEGDTFALYQALTAANPAPYAAYLQGDGFAIVSVSPEQFLNVRGRQVTTRPIKGTRLRSSNPQHDQVKRDELKASEKDRAENVMIVDLMRNDLGRVAKIGSVKVASLFDIEAHPSVWQMISTITAELRADADLVDLLRACWPPGSMTGAPKVRAMAVIDNLEPVRRGPYAGAIGYIDVSGDMDLSVIIRTAIVSQKRVMVQVGGAIVADSEPLDELDETYAKGKILFEALGWLRPQSFEQT
jgi:para-aminobenzoate synthetase component I